LNRAIKRSAGRLLVFTDDDVLADEEWLAELMAAEKRWPDDSIFSGDIDPVFPEKTPQWVKELCVTRPTVVFSDYHPGDVEGPVKNPPAGPNLMIRRPVFDDYQYNEAIGPCGSQYAMGSESELLFRLRDDGFRFIHVPTARVKHVVRPEQTEFAWLLGRAHRLGRGGRRLGGKVGFGRDLRLFGLKWTGIARLLIYAGPYFLTWCLPDRLRFRFGWSYHLALGQIFEDRLICREKERSISRRGESREVVQGPGR
jgi:glycosyltransferase involved in cell wall biosynthesis